MAGRIAVTPDQLRQQARVYLEARDMVMEMKAKVEAMNNQIAEQWQGGAFESYLQQYQQHATHINQFSDLLVDVNSQLNKYANTVEERDQQDATAFGFN